jgi:hypothetical protein
MTAGIFASAQRSMLAVEYSMLDVCPPPTRFCVSSVNCIPMKLSKPFDPARRKNVAFVSSIFAAVSVANTFWTGTSTASRRTDGFEKNVMKPSFDDSRRSLEHPCPHLLQPFGELTARFRACSFCLCSQNLMEIDFPVAASNSQ